ncbi:hypothetical protein [Phycicoccus sp.]|uniref:hypothetical protein n=1 Tax=Phycicoccus sp. TaxID=1902410 RepID=UPI002C05E1AE|nr:hypothetical protein [Phycicoccus sp.]HMM93450.1 hypothetical protein [Phycicoccus sp.]
MLPVLLIAAAIGYGLAERQKPEYTAFAAYGIVYTHGGQVNPGARDPRSDNPLFGGDATLLSEALQSDLLANASQQTLGLPGTSGVAPGQTDDGTRYTVFQPQNTQSYLIQTWGGSAADVRTVVDRVLAQTNPRIEAIQDRAGAPPVSQYSTFTTAATQVNELPPQSKLKLIVALGGIGLLTGAALSIIVDRVMTRRARRAAGGDERGDGPSDDGPAGESRHAEGIGHGDGEHAAPVATSAVPARDGGTHVSGADRATGESEDAVASGSPRRRKRTYSGDRARQFSG